MIGDASGDANGDGVTPMKGQVPAGIQQVGAIGTRPHWRHPVPSLARPINIYKETSYGKNSKFYN